jgi:hypothetical protein
MVPTVTGVAAVADSDFEVNISRWVAKQKADLETFKTALGEAEVTRLKELTPVDTGNLRSRWHVEKITDDEIVIINDAEYAHRINNGFIGTDSLGRRYHQRGVHMVEQAIAETPQIVKKAEEDLKR